MSFAHVPGLVDVCALAGVLAEIGWESKGANRQGMVAARTRAARVLSLWLPRVAFPKILKGCWQSEFQIT
jgi:hypothetical protein